MVDGGEERVLVQARGKRGRGYFKAAFQNGILSLNPHKEKKIVITDSQHYFGPFKRNASLRHFHNTNYAGRCMYTAVGVSNAIRQLRELEPLYVFLHSSMH